MAEFEVNICKIDNVIDHPNADRLTVVTIGGYECIANKHPDGSWRYNAGDYVVYIPEAAVLPENLLKKMGFWNEEKNKGMLNGTRGDRVKAIRLRGIFSQGILHPVKAKQFGIGLTDKYETEYFVEIDDQAIDVQLGQDVADIFGITKYEPPIPTQMAGEVWNAFGKTVKYDIENLQKYPDVFKTGDQVQVTEKLHGTFACFGFYPTENGIEEIVYSKGLGARGLAFKLNQKNMTNLYVKTMHELATGENNLIDLMINAVGAEQPFYIMGEIFGPGVQDLHYGAAKTLFRVFDAYRGITGQGRWLEKPDREKIVAELGLESVPLLYEGPFSIEKMKELRDGRDFNDAHIREGIVITSIPEEKDQFLGRKQLKFVSPDYILRKNGTEYQ